MTGEPPDIATSLASIDARLQQLEERTQAASGQVPELSQFWVLEGLRRLTAFSVLFAGIVPSASGGQTEWQLGADVNDLTATAWESCAPSLSALGNPVRLRLLQLIFLHESKVADLAAAPGMGTTGQVYHHLNVLSEAGWLIAAGRGRYTVPKERIVPLLTIIAAVASP